MRIRRFIYFFILLILGFLCGFYGRETIRPYRLDYSLITINLPITFRRDVNDPFWPLGEKYFAYDMAHDLKKQKGVSDVRLYSYEDILIKRDLNAGYEILLRSEPELTHHEKYHDYFGKDRISILYETVPYKLEELKTADIVMTGSKKRNEELRELGINSHFVPQFTNTDKFYPAFREDFKRKLLYIANNWPDIKMRATVQYAMNTGIELDVYGSNWQNILVGEYASWVKGWQVKNEYLKYYYSSADIVLNDMRPDMNEAGFINNRIFDVTACKGFLISDYSPVIEEIYGDAIPMYKNEQEFYELINYYLAHPQERQKKAEQAYEITINNFSGEHVLKKMWQIMEDYRLKKGIGNE